MDKRHQRIHFHPAVPCQPGQTNESGLIPNTPVSSTFLLGKQGQLEIIHDGQLYRLRKTATGKLILTK